MFPAYRGMNAYPYQRNQSPSVTYYHPSWEAVPPQTKEEPPSSACIHESWPHYGYQVPMQCHNCYSHGQRPAYYDFRSPCSHFPHLQSPPPPAYNHFCGGYPRYHQPSYPMYCAPPPPHYSVELPRYDYDKSAPRDQFHCCGCPNHTCHLKGRNGVKIEEQEPDVETKKSEPLFPAGANNFSYPIVWYPPGFVPNTEQPRRLVGNEPNDHQRLPSDKSQLPRRSIESEVQDSEGSSFSKKPQWSLENVDPNFGYRWFPFDMNNIKQLTESGEARKTHDQDKRSEVEKTAHHGGNKDQNEQMSVPIIWVPYDKLLKNHSENQVENTKAADDSPATSTVSPKNIEHADNEEVKGKTSLGNGDGRTCTFGVEKKSSNVRTIPVKQLDESVPKLSKKEEECKPTSSTKKSKLPPICLRVDPPKKKNGNGSSRSPSPPGDKKRQDSDDYKSEVKSKKPQEIKVKDIKDKTPQDNKIEVSYNTIEVGGVEKNVEHDNNSNSGIVQCGDGKVQAQESQASDTGGVEKNEVQFDYSSKPGDVKCVDDKVQAQESHLAKENEAEPEGIQKRKGMSEIEAAIVIQSAYRGYNLRRWEPLKKLKLIDKVREEAMQVKKNIEDLEARDIIDDKMKTIIGEAIMKLLLKLDTVQGLHESIRDVRRSLAKELTCLQEKLDAIMDRKYILHAQDTSTVQAAEDTKNTVSIEASKGNSEAAEDLYKGSSLDAMTNTTVPEESDSSSSHQPLPYDGNVRVSSNLAIEESLLMQSLKETQDELSMSSDVDAMVVEDMKIRSLVSENKDQEATMCSELPQEVIETSNRTMSVEDVAEGNGLLSRNHDQEVSHILDLPVANEQSLVKTSTVQDTTQQENETDVRIEDQEADVLSELPREFIEEDEKVISPPELVMEYPKGIEGRGADIVSELPREVVENDEKDMPLSELVMESSDKIQDHEANILSELPQEVVEEDKKEMLLSEIKALGNLNDENQLEERIRDNEETLATNHACDNNNPLEVSAKETQFGVEAGIVDNTSNFDIPVIKEEVRKLQESTGERETEVPQKENEVEDIKEIEEISNTEFSLGETTSLNNPPEVENNDTTGALDDDLKNKSETLQIETSEVDCSFETSYDLLRNNDKGPELLTGDQQREPVNQIVNESVMQQSYDVEQQAKQSSEVQNSATADEYEVQAEKKIKEENEKLRKLLEKLLESGKEQQEVISSLSGKVKDLEKKLAKRKTKSTKHPRIKVARSFGKPANGSLRERPIGTAS